MLVLTTIYWRESWKYGARAFRYCMLDLGHALAAAGEAACCLGWTLSLQEELGTDDLARLLGRTVRTTGWDPSALAAAAAAAAAGADRGHRAARPDEPGHEVVQVLAAGGGGQNVLSVPHALRLVIKAVLPAVVAATPLMKVRSGSRLESPTRLDFKSTVVNNT